MVRRLNFSISGKTFYTFLAVVAVIIVAAGVYAQIAAPNPGHGSDQINVDVTGDGVSDKTLQQAINDGDLSSGSSSLWTASGSNVYYNSGNVGVGTSSPLGLLHVVGGGLRVGDTLNKALLIGFNAGSDFGFISSYDSGTSAWKALVLNLGGGNVGVGTSSPTTKLEVNGDLTVSGNDIRSGTFGTNNKRASIKLDVKEGSLTCVWSDFGGGGFCSNPGVPSGPSCDTGEFSGDSSSTDTGITCSDYDGTDQQSCEGAVKYRTYRSCLDLQVQ